MAKKNLLFFPFLLFFFIAKAQYCGNSGSFQCVASNFSLPGLFPLPDSLPPFVNGQPSSSVIYFKNFNDVYYGGNFYTVNWLRIDTVDNLPPGLCWASNKADNTFANQENGCLKVSGVPCGATGQYKIRIVVTVNVGIASLQVDADQAAGLKYFVRLNNTGDAVTPVDTNQTASNAFIPYGGSCSNLPFVAYLGTNQTVCNGSVATLNATISGGQAPFTYAWSATGNNLSCNNCANPTATVTQNSTYAVTVTDANNATSTDTISYTVSGAGNNFQINASGATSFCEGSSVLLGGTSSIGFTYQWMKNNLNIGGATNTSLTVASAGNYFLVFTGNTGCYATSNVISVNVKAKPYVNIIQDPVSACTGDTIDLTASADTSVHSYAWKFNGGATGSGQSVLTTYAAGSYSVVAGSSNGCFDTAYHTITIHPLPQVSLSGIPDNICNNDASITLTGGTPAGGVYSGAGVSNNILDPSGVSAGPHYIYYTYTDSNSCSKTVSEVFSLNICTGINGLEEEHIVVLYPNPASNKLIVESDLLNNKVVPTMLVYDLTGKLMPVNCKAENGKAVLNTENLSSGVYSLRLSIEGKGITRTFIKE